MENTQTSLGYDFFLGANSPAGFRSKFYDSYSSRAADSWRAIIIKGGPGTGKSGLMKTVVKQCGERKIACERAWCSSDPDSLDGVIIPKLKVTLLDGTAPHVVEPCYPGMCEEILNLGTAWNRTALYSHGEEIAALSDRCTAYHAQATRYLAAAEVFSQPVKQLASSVSDAEKAAKSADNLYSKYIRHSEEQKTRGSEVRRLLSAITPKGAVFFRDTVRAYADRVVCIEDRYSIISDKILLVIRERLLRGGFDIISCFCSQSDRLEHIIIPSLSLAFCTCNGFHQIHSQERIIHAARFMRRKFTPAEKKMIAENERSAIALFAKASNEMRLAKALHDELESYYIAAMDFDAVNGITAGVVGSIFS
jgi:hypothetical protein